MRSMRLDFDPPFQEYYNVLLKNSDLQAKDEVFMAEECELPLIDMSKRENCREEICEATLEWGFFQVKNHGISKEILEMMLIEGRKVFYEPFDKKSKENFLNLSANSYRWGNPNASCLNQLSWSEAFNIPFSDISKMHDYGSFRSAIQSFTEKAGTLAEELAEILAGSLGIESNFFKKNCSPKDSHVRINRYPKCDYPLSSKIYGFVPHTDSDFLTIVLQDQTSGLQVKKNGKWIRVRPNSDALIVNTGDLFQALSNDVYKSVEHRVMVPQNVDRLSVAYFYCPSSDASIESNTKPALYRNFTLREYKQKVLEDLEATGNKVGLSRFLL